MEGERGKNAIYIKIYNAWDPGANKVDKLLSIRWR